MIALMRGFVKCLAGLVLLISLAFPALAQLDARAKSYYEDWLRTANRAENVIDASRASNLALEQLRSELADFRQTFQVKRGENGERIQTLQGQDRKSVV